MTWGRGFELSSWLREQRINVIEVIDFRPRRLASRHGDSEMHASAGMEAAGEFHSALEWPYLTCAERLDRLKIAHADDDCDDDDDSGGGDDGGAGDHDDASRAPTFSLQRCVFAVWFIMLGG